MDNILYIMISVISVVAVALMAYLVVKIYRKTPDQENS